MIEFLKKRKQKYGSDNSIIRKNLHQQKLTLTIKEVSDILEVVGEAVFDSDQGPPQANLVWSDKMEFLKSFRLLLQQVV